jgi:hypothetical protein
VTRPLTFSLLTALQKAGKAGLTAGDLTDMFDLPASRVRRNSRVNQLLHYQFESGRVRRSAELEISPRYQHARTWRWFITRDGIRYLAYARDGLPGAWAPRAPDPALQVRAREAREKYAAVRQAVLDGCGPGTPRPERDKRIVELAAAGVDLTLAGALFGITRERARQLVRDARPPEDNPLSLYSSQVTE